MKTTRGESRGDKLSANATFSVDDLVSLSQRTAKKVSADQKIRAAILEQLDALGRLQVSDEALIFEGEKFILPKHMEGNIGGAAKYLLDYEKAQQKAFNFSKVFQYRPFDGAAAFQRTMMKVFGSMGIGKSTFGFFGEEYKPEIRTISISPTETMQVPWGDVMFPPLEATFTLGFTRDPELGILFTLYVEAPKKHEARVHAFFSIVDQELKDNSIYKGKAINGAQEPGFEDVFQVDPRKVIYSEEVLTQLDANLWTLIRHADTMRDLGISLKRAVLVEGPYGTGKSLCGILTAQEAVRNGWTFILARPGKDDLFDVLKTARLYAPAVVWYEDIDVVAKGGSSSHLSQLLDVLDGISAKGNEIIAGFTTNHVEKIQKGVLRPGRIDAIIPIGQMDAVGFRKLVQVAVPTNLLGEVDYDKIAEAFDGLVPAFALEAIERAMRYTIARNGGTPGLIETQDLVDAAAGLRPQLEIMAEAKEGSDQHTLDRAVTRIVEDVNARTSLQAVGSPFRVQQPKVGVNTNGANTDDYDED